MAIEASKSEPVCTIEPAKPATADTAVCTPAVTRLPRATEPADTEDWMPDMRPEPIVAPLPERFTPERPELIALDAPVSFGTTVT